MQATDTPALPWGHREPATETAAQADSEAPVAIAADEAGLTLGQTIEVMWRMKPNEGKAYYKWWGATVDKASDDQPSRPELKGPRYVLRYEPFEDFPEETCAVAFLDQHHLWDEQQDDPMAWRMRGDSWEPADVEDYESEEEGEGEEVEGDAFDDEEVGPEQTFSLDEYANMMDQAGMDDATDQLMSTLQPYQRIALAAGLRDLIDTVHDIARNKRDTSDAGPITITAEDVQAAFKECESKRQRLG
mmetsp:Transcript_37114/g.82567  ORF Transcript_37114/g.82567 Transcript_37114/m.82567 type:complete len:246 (+) Transcript_37114:56-793(+)